MQIYADLTTLQSALLIAPDYYFTEVIQTRGAESELLARSSTVKNGA